MYTVCRYTYCIHTISLGGEIVIDERTQRTKDNKADVDAYILEHTYDNVSEEEYEERKALWDSLPPEEEQKNLEIMRKQLANRKYEEQRIREFEKRKKRKPQEGLFANLSSAYKHTILIKDCQLIIPDRSLEPAPGFKDVLERFMRENNIQHRSDLCRKANLTEDKLSRAISGTRPATRDMIWALAIAMGLNLEETEELFSSCDKCMYASYRLQREELDRELIFRYCIERHFKDVDEVNCLLMEYKMDLLGNRAVL